ncbi:hypothetical protein E2P81_ATG00700 [Venturia nashicola]|uniref:Uncharacterized protein n=1 Tax=Venturia nashicola TaxID=86259 RepID=A0A4Z1PPJ9_9PEZI|nr:hypothetical protein E6O75_ATG00711 [Venturia nashicola]TLD39713.1 hypothetical protein E2P81_ATG00700 [Venturia nashicola]
MSVRDWMPSQPFGQGIVVLMGDVVKERCEVERRELWASQEESESASAKILGGNQRLKAHKHHVDLNFNGHQQQMPVFSHTSHTSLLTTGRYEVSSSPKPLSNRGVGRRRELRISSFTDTSAFEETSKHNSAQFEEALASSKLGNCDNNLAAESCTLNDCTFENAEFCGSKQKAAWTLWELVGQTQGTLFRVDSHLDQLARHNRNWQATGCCSLARVVFTSDESEPIVPGTSRLTTSTSVDHKAELDLSWLERKIHHTA